MIDDQRSALRPMRQVESQQGLFVDAGIVDGFIEAGPSSSEDRCEREIGERGGGLGRHDGIAEFEEGILGACETVVGGLTEGRQGV